jgi:hypothetical protein
MAHGRFNLRGFVRVFSLGTLGVGTLCLAVARLFRSDLSMTDPHVVVGTFLGVMAVLEPDRKVYGNRSRGIEAEVPM